MSCLINCDLFVFSSNDFQNLKKGRFLSSSSEVIQLTLEVGRVFPVGLRGAVWLTGQKTLFLSLGREEFV